MIGEVIDFIDFVWDYAFDYVADWFLDNEAVETMETMDSIHISDEKVITFIVNDIVSTNPTVDKNTALLWAKKIVEQSIKYKINPFLIASQAKQESTWNPNAIGKDSDRGLLQIVDNTANEIASKLGYKNFKPDMLRDPMLNIEFSAYYLHDCYEKTKKYIGNDMGNQDWLALASYNMGVIPAVKNYISGKLQKTEYIEYIKMHFENSYNGIEVIF